MAHRRSVWLGCCLLAAFGCSEKPRPVAVAVQAARAACEYTAGMSAHDTQPISEPIGHELPIKHIVLLMQENRSFDHYFSKLPIAGLEVASPDATNPDSSGNPVSRFHLTTKCAGSPNHGWDDMHGYLDGGKLDGFVRGNGDSAGPMGYYDGGDLPYYYALAQTFAFADHHHASVLGPTWPNRMYFFAGTSWGLTHNTLPDEKDANGVPYENIFTQMDAHHVSWRVYSQDHPTPLIVTVPIYLQDFDNYLTLDKFAGDVAAGQLAQVTLVEASDVLGNLSPDEGPPGDVDIGQQFTSGVISTIMNSPFWKDTVIFLTYDENGGFYDHVVPPAACVPDGIAPETGGTVGFDQYGFRVPFFVISPYAKRGYVSHVVGDHTAILRFIEATFGLPSLTRRDANAIPPYDMFDFDHPDFSIPPLPTVTVDQAALDACN